MRRALLLVSLTMLLAPLAGCAPSLESKLIGRWRVNTEAIDFQQIAQEQANAGGKGNEMTGAMAQMAAGMLQTMLQSMKIETEFRADHTMQTTASVSVFGKSQEKTHTGTWKVESIGDNQLTVAVTLDDGKTNTMNIKFLDDNTFTAAAPLPTGGEHQVQFLRVSQGGGA